MSIVDWFAKKEKRASAVKKLNIPGDLWIKCQGCSEVLFLKDLENNLKVCPKCSYHFRVSARERLDYIFDPGSFEEMDVSISPVDLYETLIEPKPGRVMTVGRPNLSS